MFESIQGVLKDKDPSKVILETHGIGYRLLIPLNTYERLPPVGSPILLYLSQVIREESHTLYAFSSKEERDLFEILTTLSGIGPKTALSLVGHLEIQVFHQAIGRADIALLSKIPGIGKKTAERLVIEMKDKLKGKGKTSPPPPGPGGEIVRDAISALLHLGYPPLEAQKAVQAAFEEKGEEVDLSRLIAAALKNV